MILRENFIGLDVNEYAAWLGAWDCANERYNEGVFSIDTPLARELRQIYELAWDLESVSKVVYLTSQHEVLAFVREWNDLKGYGTAEYVAGGRVVRLWFNYNNMPVEFTEKELADGELVRIQFKYDHRIEGGVTVTTVLPVETVKHKVWKAENLGV